MSSIWETDVSLPRFNTFKGNRKTDVLIIGGGLAGILSAYMLKQKGINYILVEADKIFSGTSKNTTAKITSQHGFIYQKLINYFGEYKSQLYLRANQNAVSNYYKLAKNIDCDFEEKDNFVYSVDSLFEIEKELYK